MGILFRKIFDWPGDSTIRVAFTQDRVHRTAEHFGITGSDVFFFVRRWLGRKIRDVVAVLLEFLDRCRQLRNRRADVWQFNDVGIRRFDQLTEFRQSIRLPLLVREPLRKTGNDPTGKRNIASLNINPRRLRKSANNRQQRVRRQGRSFVGVSINNRRRLVRHVYPRQVNCGSKVPEPEQPITWLVGQPRQAFHYSVSVAHPQAGFLTARARFRTPGRKNI